MTGRRVVRRIDHVGIAVDDVHGVFDLLRDRLGLLEMMGPTSIPPSFGYPTAAWLNLGNVMLEILEPPPGTALPSRLEIGGIVFEPEPSEAAVTELERRGIGHTPPQRFFCPEDANRHIPDVPDLSKPEPGSPHGTQFFLQGFVGGNALILCYQWEFVSTSQMWAALRRELDEAPDRPLAIVGASEVVVGAADFDAERARWRALLTPADEVEPGSFDLGDGPALRLVTHDRDAIVGMKLEVANLGQAERHLKEHDMLASSADGELVIDPVALDGLNLSLVSARPELRRVR